MNKYTPSLKVAFQSAHTFGVSINNLVLQTQIEGDNPFKHGGGSAATSDGGGSSDNDVD